MVRQNKIYCFKSEQTAKEEKRKDLRRKARNKLYDTFYTDNMTILQLCQRKTHIFVQN